jgi:hypothetical protein
LIKLYVKTWKTSKNKDFLIWWFLVIFMTFLKQ